MNKFWIMGMALALSLAAGIAIFLPGQHGRLMPDLTGVLAKPSSKPITEPPKLEEGQSVLGKAGEAKPGQRAADGRMVVGGALPRELQPLDTGLAKLTAELQEKKQAIDQSGTPPSTEKAEGIIRQADRLVAETNRKYGIDTSHVAAVLSSHPPITDPALKQIQTKVDAVGRDIQALERRYQK